jgi:fructose-1-phosphate kinase PfkB-like protein
LHKIVTITFNPCIDKSTSIDNLIPEKKLRCSLPKFEPGAGLVLSLSKGSSPEDALRYGIECGTAATLNEGTELSHAADVDALYPLIKIISK